MAEYITSERVMNYPQIMFLKEFLVGHPGFIAGGCFRAIFAGSKPTDVDITVYLPWCNQRTQRAKTHVES